MKTIKQLNEYCRNYNFSIKVKNGQIIGLSTFDYIRGESNETN